MTKNDIISLLLADFYERFAEQSGRRIIETKSLGALFELLDDSIRYSFSKKLDKSQGKSQYKSIVPQANYLKSINNDDLRKIEFRAAYVVEFIYFSNIQLFEQYFKQFFTLFPFVTNESAKRHFAKIMADILINGKYVATQSEYEAIASSCIDWLINKQVRVAVQIWAIECLFLLQHNVDWVKEILDDVLDNLSVSPSPAMVVRLRRWFGKRE